MHNALIIGLSVALLLAVGWVVLSIGRVIFCIFRDTRRAQRRPPREMQHPEFGSLTLDGELWIGQVQRNGRSIRFCIAGTDTAADPGLLDRVRELVARFAEVERTALDFLRAQEPSVRQGEFEFYSLDFLWEDKPHLYTLESTLAGDDDGIWRVEFESGQPKFVGRDD